MSSDNYLTAENERLKRENQRLEAKIENMRYFLRGIRELSHGGNHEIWLVAGEALRETEEK